jgi:hypothetical protein
MPGAIAKNSSTDIAGIGQDIIQFLDEVGKFFGDTIVITSGYRDPYRSANAVYNNWINLREGVYSASALPPANKEKLDNWYRIARQLPNVDSSTKAQAKQDFLDLVANTIGQRTKHLTGRAVDIRKTSVSPYSYRAITMFMTDIPERKNPGYHFQSDEIIPPVTEETKSIWRSWFPTPTEKPDILQENTAPSSESGSLSNQGFFVNATNAFANIATGLSTSSGVFSTSIIPNHSRTSNLNLESLLGAEISRTADGIVDRIIGRNPNMFQASAGRFLSQSVERFGEALTKGRIDSFEDAFTSVLGGKNGAIGFASNIGNQVVGGLLQSGLGKLLGGTKTSTTSYESARSIAAGNAFGMSRGQQAAEMLTQLQKGQRNL